MALLKTTKTMQFAIQFAWFAKEYGIEPWALAQMIMHAKRSSAAYARDDMREHRGQGDKVEELASRYGCVVDWPGLWPCVQIKGRPETNRTLPCDE